jgi:hypothetical protein
MGVDPSRALQTQAAYSPSTAAQAVGAGNAARFGIRNQRAGQALNINQFGRNIPSTATQVYSGSVGAGGAAGGLNLNATGQAIGAPTSSQGFFNTANNAYTGSTGAYNDGYQNSLQANDSGFGDILGTAIGVGASIISSKKAKKNVKKTDGKGALEMVKNVGTSTYEYKEGIEGRPGADPGQHVGPMAEDMQKVGLSDGNTLNPADTAGLTMAAVQELSAKVDSINDALGIPQRRAA